MTKTAVKKKPCINSNQISDTEGSLYKLESAFYDLTLHCTFNEQYNRNHDSRYKRVGWNISEYQMQSRSGVLDSIRQMPMYEHYVPDPDQSKQQKIYSLWKRSTLSWKFECEGSIGDFWKPESQKSRNLALESIDAALNVENTNYAGIVTGLVIGLVFVSAICTLASIGFSHKRVRQMMTQFCCMISV